MYQIFLSCQVRGWPQGGWAHAAPEDGDMQESGSSADAHDSHRQCRLNIIYLCSNSLNMFVSCCIYNIHTISNKNKKSESFMIRQHKYMALLVLGRNIQCIIQKIYLNNIYSKPYLYNIDKFTLIDRYFTQFLVRVHMIHFFLLLLFLMHASLRVGVM